MFKNVLRFIVFATIAVAVSYYLTIKSGGEFSNLWYFKDSILMTIIASAIAFVISCAVALVRTRGGMTSDFNSLYVLVMSILEEHVYRLPSIAATNYIFSLNWPENDQWMAVGVINLFQTFFFVIIHVASGPLPEDERKPSFMHFIYPTIWLALGWWGGLSASLVGHLTANFAGRFLAGGDK